MKVVPVHLSESDEATIKSYTAANSPQSCEMAGFGDAARNTPGRGDKGQSIPRSDTPLPLEDPLLVPDNHSTPLPLKSTHPLSPPISTAHPGIDPGIAPSIIPLVSAVKQVSHIATCRSNETY